MEILERQVIFQNNKWLLVRCLFIFLVLASSSILYAQAHEQPKLLKFEEFTEMEKEKSLIVEKFYPIGWSKDGKFAYLVEPADEACGCYFAKVVVQDLRSDKKLWSYSYVGKEGAKESIDTFWKSNKKKISQKLRKYGIIALSTGGFALIKGDIRWRDNLLRAELKVTKNPDIEDDFNKISSIVLELISERKGRKTIYAERFGPKSYSGILDARVVGYLKSPFEARVAFILVKVRRGYEGLPHVTVNEVIGADLISGFKK
ncbi:MAG: hypothetical protein D6687_10185 [Acidobacteria bacterium]|nr:MAG: hypothetical protein D6687_10185 [Acidobacteriota bacterium]GIU81169.1 MAG: hypothetical protein KatS3mg006_0233 [Pyrinomonadaceae bacterium]